METTAAPNAEEGYMPGAVPPEESTTTADDDVLAGAVPELEEDVLDIGPVSGALKTGEKNKWVSKPASLRLANKVPTIYVDEFTES